MQANAGTSRPRVSICIPAYARPDELRYSLGSALAQTVDDIEVVVGDDSGDLDAVVRSIGDPRIRYLRNPVRLGMAGNWTATLDRARGRFLVLLNDDDLLLPEFAARCLHRFDEDPSLGVVFTDHYLEEHGEYHPRGCTIPGGRYAPAVRVLLASRPLHVSASMIRREAWEQVRPLPDLYYADTVMFLRAAVAGWPFYYLPEPLMAYHVHTDGLTYEEERFRTDRVEAWRLFSFEDPDCEDLRRRHLAKAYVSRAATHAKRGRYDAARRDARAAAATGWKHLDACERATARIALHRSSACAAAGAWQVVLGGRRVVRRARGTLGGSVTPRTRVRPEATVEGWE